MRMFRLVREVDETGISGTGVVAEGIEFSDGRVALRWQTGDHNSTVIWDSIESVRAIHGHGGLTQVVFDGEKETVVEVAQRMIAELDKAVNGITFARDATPQEVWSTLLTAVRSANRS